MTINFPLDFPSTTAPRRIRAKPSVVTAMTQSPYSRRQQIQEFGGDLWEWEMEFAPMKPSIGSDIEGFLTSLRGPAGSFIIGNPKKATPRGAARLGHGNPTVAGNGVTGNILDIDTTGLGSVAGYLLRGDQLSLGTGSDRRLYEVTKDVNLVADAALIDIWPQLRLPTVHGETVSILSPSCVFRLTQSYEGADVDEAGNYHIGTIAVIEAIGP
jgi:hypothetical protein